jgi:hypothetical protein
MECVQLVASAYATELEGKGMHARNARWLSFVVPREQNQIT